MHLTVTSALVGLVLFATAIAPTASVASPEQLAAAGENRGYSAAFRSCMASGDAADGVTSAVLDCVGAETDRQDARLNESYKLVMAHITPDQQAALRASERAWLKARDTGCKAAMGDEAGGTLGSIIYAQCVLKQEAERVRYVKAYR